MILGAILSLVLLQQPAAAEPQTPPVLTLEGRRGGFGVSDEVKISFYLQSAAQGDAAWLVHVKRDYRGTPGQVEQLDHWINGADCPAVSLAADALRDFRTLKPYGPGEPGRAAIIAPHGTRYVLTTVGAANGGEGTTVTTDLTGMILGAPLEATLNQLRLCL